MQRHRRCPAGPGFEDIFPQPPRYLLYRVLGPLGPYIVGTWEVRVWEHHEVNHPQDHSTWRSMRLSDRSRHPEASPLATSVTARSHM